MIFRAIAVVFLVGLGIAGYLHGLELITAFFQAHYQYLVLFLPLAGLILLNIEQSHLLEKVKYLKVILLNYICHFFGASVGRESTAIHFGQLLAQRISPNLKSLGAACAFSSAFGTPITAVFFPFEHDGSEIKSFKKYFLFYLATLSSYSVTVYLGSHDFHKPPILVNEWQWHFVTLNLVLVIMVLLYALILHGFKKIRALIGNPKMIFFGGSLVALTTLLLQNPRWNGTGSWIVTESFNTNLSWYDAIIKMALTAISVGSGFVGGEVVPLMAVGSSLGNWVGHYLGLPSATAAALGFALFFSFRLNILLTGFVFTFEFFGPYVALFSLPAFLFLKFFRLRFAKYF